MEYVGSGLPVLAFPHKTIQKFIEKDDVGLVFNSLNELEGLIKSENLTNLNENVLNSRQQLAVEYQISNVVNFYEQITGGDYVGA